MSSNNLLFHSKYHLNVFAISIDPCYLGLFDGYHGDAAARTCSEKMGQFIFEEIRDFQRNRNDDMGSKEDRFSCTNIGDKDSKEHLTDVEISNCIARAYRKMDQFLGHGISEKSR